MITTFSKTLLEPYQTLFEKALKKKLETYPANNMMTTLVQESLTGKGKRLRPCIVLMLAKALNQNKSVISSALAVEFFHTASLIVDDLPCMDNDFTRRGKAALHITHGEAPTILASYALIAEGYSLITQNSIEIQQKEGEVSSAELCRVAVQNVAQNMGVEGATNGQFLDLFPTERNFQLYKEIARKKTVTLFEIAFVLGWLFGGGNMGLLPLVKQAAYHFGMAFQMFDDFDDVEEDMQRKDSLNFVCLLGEKEAEKVFSQERERFLASVKSLNLPQGEELSSLALLFKR